MELPAGRRGSLISEACGDISEHVQSKMRSGSVHEGTVVSTEGPSHVLGSFSSIKLAFLTARQPLLDGDQEPILQSDIAVFSLQISLIADYGILHLFCAAVGCAFFSVLEVDLRMFVCAVHGAAVFMLFCGVHLVNRFRWMKQKDVFQCCAVLLVVLDLCGGPLGLLIIQCQMGLHWSEGPILWVLGAPLGAFLLIDRPALPGCVFTSATMALMVAVVVYFAIARPQLMDGWMQPSLPVSMIGYMLTWGAVPAVVAAMFRVSSCILKPHTASSFMAADACLVWQWQCKEHHARLAAHDEYHLKLTAVRATMEKLIFSIIPPNKVKQLPGIMPERWFTSAYDEYPDCTLLQARTQSYYTDHPYTMPNPAGSGIADPRTSTPSVT